MLHRRKKGTGTVKRQKEYKRDKTGLTIKDGSGAPVVKRIFYRGSWSTTDCYQKVHRVSVTDAQKKACRRLLDEAIEKKQTELAGLESQKWMEDRSERMHDFRGTVSDAPINPFPDRPPTISEFIEKCYWNSNYASGQSHGTRANYNGYFVNHIKVAYDEGKKPLGDIRINEIKLTELKDFDCSKEGVISVKTRNHILNFLRGVYTLAMSGELRDFTGVRANVPKEFKPIRSGELAVSLPRQALGAKTFDEIRAKAEEAKDYTMVNLILFSQYGVRPNAAASLQWASYDEENGVFPIIGQFKTENGNLIWRPPKNRKAYLVPVLPRHLRLMERTAEYSAFVCPTSKKRPDVPIRSTTWGERFKLYATQAGYPDVVLYDAKSSTVTNAINMDISADRVGNAMAISGPIVERFYNKQTVEGRRALYAQLFGDDCETLDTDAEENP
jgi:hypothetical protein